MLVLPEFTEQGELPVGLHVADWPGFQARFCGSSPKRIWLAGRLQALLQLAAGSRELRRVFVWGSFVTAKASPGDLDILPIMDEGFSVDDLDEPAQAVFDSVRARLLFQADVFWLVFPLGTRCSICGSKRIRLPEAFESAVLWNWS